MERRFLPNTDIEFSVLTMGCWGIVGGFNWGPQDESDSLRALRAAFEAGIVSFDTAEAYGEGYSERLIGKALGSVRDEIVIASKVAQSNFAPDDLKAACERSLRNLDTDRIDVYQLHWPNPSVPLEDAVAVLESLLDEGKIRSWGVSNFGVGDLRKALGSGSTKPVVDQVAYNLLFRAVEYEIQPFCAENEVGILTYSSIMQGLLAGKFACPEDVPDDRARTRHFSCDRSQAHHGEAGCEAETFEAIAAIRTIADEAGSAMADLAIAWLAAQSGVVSVIVGARNPRQVERNANAAKVVLSEDVVSKMDEATQSLKELLGSNADMWEGDSRIQ